MIRRLIVIGGGGHARVVIEAAQLSRISWEVIGYVDNRPVLAPNAPPQVPYLGTDDDLAALLDVAGREAPAVVLAVGRGDRRRIVERLDRLGVTWATVIHGAAWHSPSAAIGRDAVIMAGVVVQAGARIGDHVILNTGAIIEHDVTIGDYVSIGPGARIGGRTVIGLDVLIGLGASIRDGCHVGDRAIIGMGAAVVGDVAADTMVLGVPARVASADGDRRP